MVLSIEAKQDGPRWEAYTDNGREHTGLDAVEWASRGAELGAGEILLTSVDREGTRSGFELELVHAVATAVDIPVIASGGMGTIEHVVDVVERGAADAVAIADALHYDRVDLGDIRRALLDRGISVRRAPCRAA
jgi:cyclase